MKNKRTAVDAVDLAYTFGLQDKFSTQTMLTSFLRESKEFWKKTKKTSQGSLHALVCLFPGLSMFPSVSIF